MQTTRVAAGAATQVQTGRRFRLTYLQQRNLWGFLFAVPALLLFAVFSIYPIASTVVLSFFDYSVVDPPKPVGLQNYQEIIGDPRFHASLFNSLRYVFSTYVPVWIL